LATDHFEWVTDPVVIGILEAVARAVVVAYGVGASAAVGGCGVVIAGRGVLATDHLVSVADPIVVCIAIDHSAAGTGVTPRGIDT
jgi:hypothetical protein